MDGGDGGGGDEGLEAADGAVALLLLLLDLHLEEAALGAAARLAGEREGLADLVVDGAQRAVVERVKVDLDRVGHDAHVVGQHERDRRQLALQERHQRRHALGRQPVDVAPDALLVLVRHRPVGVRRRRQRHVLAFSPCCSCSRGTS